ncbi:MAG: M23 family metallopeptidase [Deltaproteobacteria bacterium]|nr:M23 family metallopeptidase [Deltaproteobacteria bacterium]
MAAALMPLIGVLVVSGCGSSAPSLPPAAVSSSQTTYVVKSGDTVYRIAARFAISTTALMNANGISNPRDLRVGQVLTIPGAYRGSPPAYAGSSHAFPYRGERASRQFGWPISDGMVSSGFGIRNGAMHQGIDIAAPEGTPVHAADGGTVIFSGALHGYGNVVIIGHDDDYATVYGHNQVNLVREGERVVRGQTIARIGTSGRTTGANLHFEVRYQNVAHNPLAYLPEPPAAPGITYAEQSGT